MTTITNDFSMMTEGQYKTLEVVKGYTEEHKNKIFKIEKDEVNKVIKVISKRRSMNGKGFTIPYFKELLNEDDQIIEKFLSNCYLTSIYLYC